MNQITLTLLLSIFTFGGFCQESLILKIKAKMRKTDAAISVEMIKSFLNVDKDVNRISRKQYNKEIVEAVARMEKGNSVSNKDAHKELSKW